MDKITCFDILGNKHICNIENFVKRRAVYGIYIKNHEVLLAKDMHANTWDIPGGGVEGQPDIVALRREFREETGLEIEGITKIGYDRGYYFDLPTNKAWDSERIFYKIQRVEGTILEHGNEVDVNEVKFVRLDKLYELNIKQLVKDLIYEASAV
jgi:8-oxo-dGTP pyrophosphatase MutT (NUDIX family)